MYVEGSKAADVSGSRDSRDRSARLAAAAPEVAELESLQRRKDDLEQLVRQERNRRHALA